MSIVQYAFNEFRICQWATHFKSIYNHIAFVDNIGFGDVQDVGQSLVAAVCMLDLVRVASPVF